MGDSLVEERAKFCTKNAKLIQVRWLLVAGVLVGSSAMAEEITVKEGLAARATVVSGWVRKDPVMAALADGSWRAPKEGDDLGETKWVRVGANKEGWFQGEWFRNGYSSFQVEADHDRVMLLEAVGPSVAYVNGEPHVGDVYSAEYVSLPVRLKKGANEFLFFTQRGRLKLKLVDPPQPISLDARDATLPDLVAGKKGELWAAVVVRNATDWASKGLKIEAVPAQGRAKTTSISPVPALATRKVGFKIDAGSSEEITLRLRNGREVLDTVQIKLRKRAAGQTYRQTFVSEIDGSVQFCGINPAVGDPNRKALILSVHGAGVDAWNQADAYSAKRWGTLVAATNRRPYGYDWEDWGRMDAMEVFRNAKAQFKPDPSRIYLTGHSMGGHGTWYLGALYPDQFAAIGPSAGWRSSFTYAGSPRPADEGIPGILRRASEVGDTLLWGPNYASEGIYILHGTADESVDVEEAREMAKYLSGFHKDFVLHEQPGQPHWWDLSSEPGADAVDWAPMNDFFLRHALPNPNDVRHVDFTTLNPGVSATCRWVTIQAQATELKPSRVEIDTEPWNRRIFGRTTNVARLSLDLACLQGQGKATVELDNDKFEVTTPVIHLRKENGHWQVGEAPPPGEKNPLRYGPFREGLNHRMMFVYGTKGTPEENAWAYNKARYDAEVFWYRGNGALDVIPDTEFNAAKEKDRGVVLYGNADTNAAWSALMSDSPIQMRRGQVKVGGRELTGDSYGGLVLRPRQDSNLACVAAIGGSGLVGMRQTDAVPYLTPMIGFPDFMVLGPNAAAQGVDAVRVAGFFGLDWGLATGDVAWGKE